MSILSLNKENLKEFLKINNLPSFHLKQINEWVFKKNVLNFEQMSNLSFSLKEKLNTNLKISTLKLVKVECAKNNETKKYLFELEDKKLIETVLIIAPNRTTICVSSQVGCTVGCKFCASGKNGFFRNLKTYEIIEQILFVANDLKKYPSHIVFMGMGEPLLNYDNLIESIKILSNENFLNISQRRITVSTVGIVPQIKKLKNENLKINLCLSLHASNDEIRNKIIPFSKHFPLNDILNALKDYFETTKRDIAFEYILLEKINDSLIDAQNLYNLIKNFQCSLNLIPYNPIDDGDFIKPSSKRVEIFKKYLIDKKLNVTQRYTKGDDISAACGQLVLK